MSKTMITMHASVANGANIADSVYAAKAAGYDAISPAYDTLRQYLDVGHSIDELNELIGDLAVTGVGWLYNIERQGADYDVMMAEAEEMFRLSEQIHASDVEIFTGPLDMAAIRAHLENKEYDGYMGLQDMPTDEQIRLTAKNGADLAKLAAKYGLELHLELLSWAPISQLNQGLEVIKQAGCDNLKIIIDFWQLNNAGATPEDVAAVPKENIGVIHVCNGRQPNRGVPYESEPELRDASLDDGIIDIPAWVNAVKATGFVGTWACECFDKKQHQMPLLESAKKNYQELSALVK